MTTQSKPNAGEQKPPEDKTPKEKTYVVKHGALIVGKNEMRVVGQTIKASELSKKETRFFLEDGTIAEAKG